MSEYLTEADVKLVADELGLEYQKMPDYNKAGVFTLANGKRFSATWAHKILDRPHAIEQLRRQLQYQMSKA
jgi:hypothetical protein